MPHVRQMAPSGGEQKTKSPRQHGHRDDLLSRECEKRTTQTYTTDKAHVHNLLMAKARSPKIHIHLSRQHQVPPTRLVRQEGHHQVLQQALRLLQRHVDALRRVGRLLQEHGVARDLADIDGDAFPLGGDGSSE